MSAAILLVIAAVAAVASASLLVTAVTLPASRRAQMLKILAAFGRGGTPVSEPTDQRTFTSVMRPPVVKFLQIAGNLITPPFIERQIARQLNLAGNPPLWPVDRVIRARMVGAVVGGVLGLLLLRNHHFLGTLGGLALGLFLPQILVGNMAQKRQTAMEQSLPDVLDALVIGVEAGLGLDSAMAQVAAMLRGPMPDEVRRVLQEMQLGVARSEALRDLAERTSVLEVKRLVTALVQAGELGISVGGILREHASEQRVRRRQRAEEQAQKVAVKLLFPVLFCLFPVIFVVVIGPAVLNMLRNF